MEFCFLGKIFEFIISITLCDGFVLDEYGAAVEKCCFSTCIRQLSPWSINFHKGEIVKELDLLKRWFMGPIKSLKKLPNGDGAFAALMISIPLYERCLIASLKKQEKYQDENNRDDDDEIEKKKTLNLFLIRSEMSKDLELTEGQQCAFWDMFRNGFMHQAMVHDGKTKWRLHDSYEGLPRFVKENGVEYVELNPWKFAERILKKYEDDPDLFSVSKSFPLPEIFELPLTINVPSSIIDFESSLESIESVPEYEVRIDNVESRATGVYEPEEHKEQ